MTAQRLRGQFVSGFRRAIPAGGARVDLSPLRLMGKPTFFGEPEEIHSVEPWGYLIPAEGIETDYLASFYADMDAQSVPHGSVFTVRFALEDGSEAQSGSSEYLGPNPVVRILLPPAWFRPAVGKRASLTYEVELPDGRILPGAGISLVVLPFIEVGPIRLEGMDVFDSIDPVKFPDGVVAVLDRMRFLLPFSDPMLRITTLGNQDGYLKDFATWSVPLEGIEQDAVRVNIDPFYYVAPYQLGFTDVYLSIHVLYEALPPPNTDWNYFIKVGSIDVLPPS